ncbi:unnamed protein product [Amoebophrya sp. A120]|nr:unnamed protein product [Amoebophrya sp. A120]|eukprot:GSA120T00003753001.1
MGPLALRCRLSSSACHRSQPVAQKLSSSEKNLRAFSSASPSTISSSTSSASSTSSHRAKVRSSLPERFTKEEKARLSTFFARATICARLLHSRLALPLTYPMNSVAAKEFLKNDGNGDEKTQKVLEEQEQMLSAMRPALISVASAASIVKSLHALKYYQGSPERGLEPEPDKTRLDFLRPQNLRRKRRQTRVGMGDGWDAWGSGRTADDVKRRFVVDLQDEEEHGGAQK